LPHRTRSATPARAPLAAVAALLVALGACGGDPDAGDTGGAAQASTTAPTESGQPAGDGAGQSITVTQTDFEIDLPEDTFAAGEYVFEVVNDGGSTHDLVIARDGEVVTGTEGADPGGTSTLTVTLEPGEYVLYCSIANHRAMGMETTIEVT
jgi:plastocyanin